MSRHRTASLPQERADMAKALARLREAGRARDEAARKMDALLAKLGYGV